MPDHSPDLATDCSNGSPIADLTIRRYYADGDHAAAQKLKNQLPCFTPAGTFNGAHAIKHFLLPSHIVGLDYDHVKNRLEVIQRCAADPHTVAAIDSISVRQHDLHLHNIYGWY